MLLLALLLFLVHGSLLINHSHVSSCYYCSLCMAKDAFVCVVALHPASFACFILDSISLNHQVHFEGGSRLVI